MKYVAAIVGVVLIGLGAFVFLSLQKTEQSAYESADNTPREEVTLPENIVEDTLPLGGQEVEVFSRAEIKQHASETDCWVGFRGSVYDITDWLTRHPGSPQSILPFCGMVEEFEAAFTGKHGERNVGVLESQGILKGAVLEE